MDTLSYYLFCFALLITACDSPESPDCFKSRGSDATETRPLSAFNKIEVLDYIEVEIVMDTVHYVEIHGGENLLPKIKTRIEDKTLHIDNDNTCNFVRSFNHQIRVTVHTPELQSLILWDGSGSVRSLGTLSGDSLFVETNHASGDISLDLEYRVSVCLFPTGTSDVRLRGEVDRLEMFSDSYGKIDASQLAARIVLVNNSSINDFYIWPSEYFYAAINDRGNIYVRAGEIANDILDNGSGSVIYIE